MSTTTRLVLRADSGAAIGVGHVARCVGFAEQARARGWWVGFAGTVAGHFADALDSLGVQRIAVDRLLDCAADVVLIDNYSVGDVRADVHASGALLVSVEDGRFGRRPADVVVDCGLVRHARPDDGSTLVLAGCEYAPLRARVRVARDVRRARPVDGEPLDVLVVLGGTPAVDVLDAVLTAVLTAVRQAGVRARMRAFSTAETVVAQRFPHVTVQRPTPMLPELAAAADLVISAAGMTLLELCCIGVPTAVVLLADNQEASYRAAVARGLAVGLGTATELVAGSATAAARLHPLLGPLLTDPAVRANLAGVGAMAIDGLGAARVLDAVSRLTSSTR